MIPWPKSFNVVFNMFDAFNLKVRAGGPSLSVVLCILTQCWALHLVNNDLVVAAGVSRACFEIPPAAATQLHSLAGARSAQVFTFPGLACMVRSPGTWLPRGVVGVSIHLALSSGRP
jgi:hypothetical protein